MSIQKIISTITLVQLSVNKPSVFTSTAQPLKVLGARSQNYERISAAEHSGVRPVSERGFENKVLWE